MRKTLQWIKDRFNNPEIFIFENGFADLSGNLDDLQRIHYLKHNINNVLKGLFPFKIKIKTSREEISNHFSAINDGVRVGGYAAWSLMDNLEWGGGFT